MNNSKRNNLLNMSKLKNKCYICIVKISNLTQ